MLPRVERLYFACDSDVFLDFVMILRLSESCTGSFNWCIFYIYRGPYKNFGYFVLKSSNMFFKKNKINIFKKNVVCAGLQPIASNYRRHVFYTPAWYTYVECDQVQLSYNRWRKNVCSLYRTGPVLIRWFADDHDRLEICNCGSVRDFNLLFRFYFVHIACNILLKIYWKSWHS